MNLIHRYKFKSLEIYCGLSHTRIEMWSFTDFHLYFKYTCLALSCAEVNEARRVSTVQQQWAAFELSPKILKKKHTNWVPPENELTTTIEFQNIFLLVYVFTTILTVYTLIIKCSNDLICCLYQVINIIGSNLYDKSFTNSWRLIFFSALSHIFIIYVVFFFQSISSSVCYVFRNFIKCVTFYIHLLKLIDVRVCFVLQDTIIFETIDNNY